MFIKAWHLFLRFLVALLMSLELLIDGIAILSSIYFVAINSYLFFLASLVVLFVFTLLFMETDSLFWRMD